MLGRWSLIIAAGCGLFVLPNIGFTADVPIDYSAQIKPVLRRRCFACHGALKQEGDLRLDTVALMLQDGVVAPGKVSDSILLDRISSTDSEERMPPEHSGEPLSAEQISLIRRWIAAGATAPADEQQEADPKDHWAFQPIIQPALPTSESSSWGKNPIDAFIAQQHRRHGLQPQADAPRVILIRRLYLDLIGIPPTLEEITAGENDESPQWLERIADRLLDDPRHGERWARHWMDIWRYSDWWGLGQQLRNSQKHIWHWRDWIVESLNDDTPYDEMVRLMLAADELYPNDPDKLRATGYLARNYFLFNRPQWMEETVEHVAKGFLGLTINCAKCHDHKYDPIEQVDFYKMRAFFEPYHVRLDMVPGEPDLSRDGIPRVFDGLPDAKTHRYIRGDSNNPDKSIAIAPGVPKFIQFADLSIEPVPLSEEAWQPERRKGVLETYVTVAEKKVKDAETALLKLQDKLKTTNNADTTSELKVAELNVSVALAELESVHRRVDAMRASWNDSTDEAKLGAAESAIRAERQLTLAKAHRDLARAELQLLKAASDKKSAAEKQLATAQEVLQTAEKQVAGPISSNDSFTRFTGAAWSATRFLDSTKDDPAVEFRPQSTGRRTALAAWITDRRNPLTARVAANHIWMRHMGTPLVSTVFDFGRNGAVPTHPELLDFLAAELVNSGWSMKHLHRLIVTSAAYRMSSSVAGSEVSAAKDPENRYLWRRTPIRLESQAVRDSILALSGTLDRAMGGPPVLPSQQDSSTRRGLYFFHSNNQRNLFLTTFDEALVKDCYRRDQSIVPQQALALTNSKLVLDASVLIAKRLSDGAANDSDFVANAFIVVLGIHASDMEIKTSVEALDAWRILPDGSADKARSNFIWALINHNDFVTLR